MATTMESQLNEAFGTETANTLAVPETGVVAVILAYNEALRFPYFLEHYRQIGVSHFIVVENASTDGTAAILAAQEDVSVITTKNPYRDFKSVWRQLLCERYLVDRWVVFPDVDELFVYPGWPERSIDDLVSYLDAYRYRALFCPMVDMYPDKPLKDLSYEKASSFIDACPYFDPDGYRYNPLKGSHRKRYKTPARHIFGGTRERLFHQNAKRKKTFLDKLLLGGVFSLSGSAGETTLGRIRDHLLFKLVKDAVPDTAAVQSKIPLLKWQSGTKFSGGVHGIDRNVSVAPDWGALLHFKYLDDFSSKVAEALERQQHTDNSGHYRDYNSQLGSLSSNGLHYSGSARFENIHSLQRAGLVRESRQLKSWRGRGPVA